MAPPGRRQQLVTRILGDRRARGPSPAAAVLVRALASGAPPERRAVRRRTVPELVGDPVLLLVAGLLIVAGLGAVYAATRDSLTLTGASGTRYVARDAINVGVALAVGLFVAMFGHRRLLRLAPALFTVACVALLGVLTPAGATINGAKAWYALGPVQVEPSQLAVLAFIVLVAAQLGPHVAAAASPARTGSRLPAVPVLLCAGGAALVAALIVAEPALGMTVVLAVVAAGLLVLAGLRARTLTLTAVVGAALGVAAWHGGVIKPYQQHRLTAFLHPQLSDSTGYQVLQALTAVGSGGLTGQGLLNGSQTNGGFVPEQPTDFVFTAIAEETGFVGAAVVLVLLAWLCVRALRIASAAGDGEGLLLAGGLGVWFAIQTFINVGMAVGIMPVTGIPLPLISYGGSALCVDLVAVALLASIARQTAAAPRRT